MSSLVEDLEKHLREGNLSDEKKVRLRAYIAELKSMGTSKLNDPEKFDAKGMTPVGQDEPIDWNPKKE